MTADRSGWTNDWLFPLFATLELPVAVAVDVEEEAGPLPDEAFVADDFTGIFSFMPSERSSGVASTSRLASNSVRYFVWLPRYCIASRERLSPATTSWVMNLDREVVDDWRLRSTLSPLTPPD
jgi:hypothetical protein